MNNEELVIIVAIDITMGFTWKGWVTIKLKNLIGALSFLLGANHLPDLLLTH